MNCLRAPGKDAGCDYHHAAVADGPGIPDFMIRSALEHVLKAEPDVSEVRVLFG